MTDRDVTRGAWPPDGGRSGRPDWWSATAPPDDASPAGGAGGPGRLSGRAGGSPQADGWTAPARQGAYGSTLPEPSRASSGPYGGAPGFSANPRPVASNYPAPTDAPQGAYGGSGGGYGASDAMQVQGGSSSGWSPPRSGAYGGASAPTQVQGGGWGPPSASASAAPPQAPPTVPQSPGWPPTPVPVPGSSYPPGGGPAYGPPGSGYGGAPPGPPVGGGHVRHRPGLGLILGLAGAAALVLSLTSLPWVDQGGIEASFSDIRDAYENVDDRTEAPLTSGPSGGTTDTTIGTTTSLPPSTAPDGSPLPPIGQAVEPPDLPTPSEAADEAVNTGKNTYLEVYTTWGWIGVLGGVTLAILFATLVVPANKGGRMLTGFLTAGMLGLLFNAADDEGRFGPRVSGAIAALVVSALHVGAVWSLFSEEVAPDPALGVWVGVAGLVTVLVACLVGTRTERVAAGYR